MSQHSERATVQNWAGNVTFTQERVHRPRSVAELAALVEAVPAIHALGTGHSFSTVADSPGALVSVAGLPQIVELDTADSTVTVSAGIRWGELAPILHAADFSLPNLGSLPHISVAGSVATGTHGSGSGNRCLAGAVSALELVTADGGLLRIDRSDVRFAGSVVALGALGVCTQLTLDLQPTYSMHQVVYDDLPWVAALDWLDAILDSCYSVSMFTRWRGTGFEQVWLKQRAGSSASVDLVALGAIAATSQRHPVPGMAVEHCTEQMGAIGPWFERLPHFRPEFTPSSGDELQSEYLIPRRDGRAALEAINRLRHAIAPVLQVGEVRTVAADNLWLSAAEGRDSLAIHFTWIADLAAVSPVLWAVENCLAPFAARPHWGKVFASTPADVAVLYPYLPAFRQLAQEIDPTGKFHNSFLERYVFGQV